ncbi:MFS transporter (plasmid) [Ensifer adhaerens]
MLGPALARYLARRNIHYGWAVAAVTFLVMLSTAGAMGSAGVLIKPLETEFGWTNAQISLALAIRLCLFGLLGPFAASFMNHFGVRPVVSTALILIISGIAASFYMTELWHLVAIWGVVLGVGTGMTALVLGATVATRWFDKRRGLVVGLMTASNATGQLVFLPLLASLTETIGWRSALTLIIVILLAAFTLVLLLMQDRPGDLGLAPFGGKQMVAAPPKAKSFGELLMAPIRALSDAAKTNTFWVLFATFFVCGFSTNGLIQTHWVSICGDVGIAPVAAASLLALIGVFDLIGTIGSGWLSDRYDNRWLLFWFYGLRGLSLMFLPFSGFNIYTLSIFAIFYGLDWVATVPPTVKLSAERFGPERAALVFGWVFTGHQLGAASATFLAGASRTSLETYAPALIAAGMLCIVAALLVLTIGRRQPEALTPQPA